MGLESDSLFVLLVPMNLSGDVLSVTIDFSGFDLTFDVSNADARDFQCVPHTFVTLIGCVFSIHFVCYAGDQRERE